MRDILKDKEYLEAFISRQCSRIEELQESLLEVDRYNERIISNINSIIFQSFLEVLFAKYSVGNDVGEIKGYFLKNLSFFEASYETGNYAFYLQYIALARLLNIDEFATNRIRKTLSKGNTNDAFYNFILSGNYEGRDWKFIQKYKEVIEANPEDRVQLVKKLLSKWYVSNRSSYWYDFHKQTERSLYFGYWALEIAALVKVLNIPDDSFKDKKYYPYDLVHFGG